MMGVEWRKVSSKSIRHIWRPDPSHLMAPSYAMAAGKAFGLFAMGAPPLTR